MNPPIQSQKNNNSATSHRTDARLLRPFANGSSGDPSAGRRLS